MRAHNSVTTCGATRSSLVGGSLYSELVVVNGPGDVASGAVWPNETVVAASRAVRRAIANLVFCIGYSWEAGYCYFVDLRLSPCHYPDFCTKGAFSSSRSDGLNLAVRFNARKARRNAPASRSDD